MSGTEIPTGNGSGGGWAVREMVMVGAIAALIATNGYTLYRSEEAKTELQNLDASFRARIISERETNTASIQETRRALDQIAQQLSEAKGESQAIVQKANQASFAARQKAGEPYDFHIGGSDASGIVWAVGEEVTDLGVGDHVVTHPGYWNADDRWIAAGATPSVVRKTFTGGGVGLSGIFLGLAVVSVDPIWNTKYPPGLLAKLSVSVPVSRAELSNL